MQTVDPNLNNLFEQLGLASDDQSINQFIEQNKGQVASTLLHEMPMWNDSQAEFLRQAKAVDAEWAEIVDELDARLR